MKHCFVSLLFASTSSLAWQAWSFSPHRRASSIHPLERKQLLSPRQGPLAPYQTVLFGSRSQEATAVEVGPAIGSGSYGTVHFLTLDGDKSVAYVGKRAWKEQDLEELLLKEGKNDDSNDENDNKKKKPKDLRERAQRCQYYWDVEAHCFDKIAPHPQIPPYFGTRGDWMIFGLVEGADVKEATDTDDDDTGNFDRPPVAPTLADLMKLDLDHPQELAHTSKALGCTSYAETLDRVLESLLDVLTHVHDHKIVHRDIKPSNLLASSGTANGNPSLVLMDFGSAADLEPQGALRRRKGLENGSRVAVSPIYCAPEIFIEVNQSPTTFDIFSSALLFCQLLFSYLDERMDAGFHQQLEETKWDLNLWLENELGSKLRPQGLEHALEYLRDRPGLWTLLQAMLAENPMDRPKAPKALARFRKILKEGQLEDETKRTLTDSPYFTMVLEALETCEIPTMSRPLHFVATFSRNKSLGLVLSEKDDEVDDPFWQEATKDAESGEVFVLEVVPGGQADELGIFEVGDRLDGIGELPFSYGGFERAIEMLQDQPKRDRNVRLHFDRIDVRSNEAIAMVPSADTEIAIADRGAWSSIGRRKAQEDAFVLHEIHDTTERSVLLAGIMDGHGGTAASAMVSSDLPSLLSNELIVNRLEVPEALENAWNTVCDFYRQGCEETEECVADYDAAEGVLMANTGSEDLIAGTTASVMALDETTAKLTVLNCGDSRSLVATQEGKVKFVTKDHKPQVEEDRILKGIKDGLDYSPPQCSWGRWWVKVGDYEYSVARSLEGPFATSKGIVSDPDLTTLSVTTGDMLISATDGLWDVMDSREVAIDLSKMRKTGKSASDAAKALCSMAWNKGTSDNVSAVVVYL